MKPRGPGGKLPVWLGQGRDHRQGWDHGSRGIDHTYKIAVDRGPPLLYPILHQEWVIDGFAVIRPELLAQSESVYGLGDQRDLNTALNP
jgi:hypothetical protein